MTLSAHSGGCPGADLSWKVEPASRSSGFTGVVCMGSPRVSKYSHANAAAIVFESDAIWSQVESNIGVEEVRSATPAV
eukprot:CAMPEP_0113292568 /NCGR_PEP_ID=MMETSP0008_2-20120614/34734_1 /TAXON_ID=97485 /ORGANISM="Prymnesium parvum" /LENGTH=77 /DNA_ID=CAMNT_0000144721 /DNA_START=1224 /DNA_END=1457 /DNA_ORIENTATION=- /assembly_acc=CAM_ASM_000153